MLLCVTLNTLCSLRYSPRAPTPNGGDASAIVLISASVSSTEDSTSGPASPGHDARLLGTQPLSAANDAPGDVAPLLTPSTDAATAPKGDSLDHGDVAAGGDVPAWLLRYPRVVAWVDRVFAPISKTYTRRGTAILLLGTGMVAGLCGGLLGMVSCCA